LGQLSQAEGDSGRAVEQLTGSLQLWRALGQSYGVALCLMALGTSYQSLGDVGQARAAWSEAREYFIQIGNVTEAGRLDDLLAELPGRPER
jgi:Flp pilus assembly protein TadD